MGLEEDLKRNGITFAPGTFPEAIESVDPNGDAINLVANLHELYGDDQQALLAARSERQAVYDKGDLPEFDPKTEDIRTDTSWKVASIPEDLQTRWVELTGPANDERMVQKALTSGANTWMADLEDSLARSPKNVYASILNLYRAASGQMEGVPANIRDAPTKMMIRAAGLHLDSPMMVDEKHVSASLFDLGMIFGLIGPQLEARESTNALYFPKLEHGVESAFVSDVTDTAMHIMKGNSDNVRFTFLIETLMGTFQAAEILHNSKQYAIGLNVGRWDQMASWYQMFRAHEGKSMPDRKYVDMTSPHNIAYQELVRWVCYMHGAQPIGGMAGQVPTKQLSESERDNMVKAIIEDAEREADFGFLGKWAAHPATIPTIQGVFREKMGGQPYHSTDFKNSLGEGFPVTADQLISVPEGPRTYEGLVDSLREAIIYIGHWYNANGCVAIDGKMMSDAATAEIARHEVTHRLRHESALEDGKTVNPTLLEKAIGDAQRNVAETYGNNPMINIGKGVELLKVTLDRRPQYFTMTADPGYIRPAA